MGYSCSYRMCGCSGSSYGTDQMSAMDQESRKRISLHLDSILELSEADRIDYIAALGRDEVGMVKQ